MSAAVERLYPTPRSNVQAARPTRLHRFDREGEEPTAVGTLCVSPQTTCVLTAETGAHKHTRPLKPQHARARRQARQPERHMGFYMSNTARDCPIPRVTPDRRRRVALRKGSAPAPLNTAPPPAFPSHGTAPPLTKV
jgi:hypothetical protein